MVSSRIVRIEKAYKLLLPGIVKGAGGTWADLGCGDGIFTTALARLLGPGSVIYAVDTRQAALRSLAGNLSRDGPDAIIHTVQVDFTRFLDLPPLDGVLMANSLHFVESKQDVLARIVGGLKPGGHLVVVEYNTRQGNRWVPFPLDDGSFLALAQRLGLYEARLLTKIPSTFLGEMYSAMGSAPKGSA